MNLTKIAIENFKSIDKLEIDFSGTNSDFIGLLGLNESGKSNILKAITLKDSVGDLRHADYVNNKNPQENIVATYEFTAQIKFSDLLELDESSDIQRAIANIKVTNISLRSILGIDNSHENEIELEYDNQDFATILSQSEEDLDGLDLEKFNVFTQLEMNLKENIEDYIVDTIFWKSSSEYLLNNKIPLVDFSAGPEKYIPLKNCFELAGVTEEDIPNKVTEILDPKNTATRCADFLRNMERKVERYMNTVLPKKEVDEYLFTFRIDSSNNIDFSIREKNGDKEGVSTSMNDRSDGFRQFISFLLSTSMENKNDNFENNILIIDEPETHLHPTAQRYLLEEFKKISKRNILIFATHSSYLIDKENFRNYYRVHKEDNLTLSDQFTQNTTSFAEINYEVFRISSSDYHNELYGKIESIYRNQFKKDMEKWEGVPDNPDEKPRWRFYNFLKDELSNPKMMKWRNDTKDCAEEDCTIQTYIRHQIHHPENSCGNAYLLNKDAFLEISIKKMLVLYKKLVIERES